MMAKLNASEIADILDNVGDYSPMTEGFHKNDNLLKVVMKCLENIKDIKECVYDKTTKKNKEKLQLINGLVNKIIQCVNYMSVNYNDKRREVEGRDRTFGVLKEDIKKAKITEKVIREELHKVIKMQVKERLSEAYDDGFHSAQDYDNDY